MFDKILMGLGRIPKFSRSEEILKRAIGQYFDQHFFKMMPSGFDESLPVKPKMHFHLSFILDKNIVFDLKELCEDYIYPALLAQVMHCKTLINDGPWNITPVHFDNFKYNPYVNIQYTDYPHEKNKKVFELEFMLS